MSETALQGLAGDALRHDIRRTLSPFGLRAAAENEVAEGRDLAARLIDPNVASADVFLTVHRLTGGATFVYVEEGRITGALAIILLRASGLAALEADRFEALSPPLDQISRPGEIPAAVYGWGFAARTDRAGSAVVRGAVALREGPFAHLPVFTRAATPDGVRVIAGPMGYVPYPGSPTGMLWSPLPRRAAP